MKVLLQELSMIMLTPLGNLQVTQVDSFTISSLDNLTSNFVFGEDNSLAQVFSLLLANLKKFAD